MFPSYFIPLKKPSPKQNSRKSLCILMSKRSLFLWEHLYFEKVRREFQISVFWDLSKWLHHHLWKWKYVHVLANRIFFGQSTCGNPLLFKKQNIYFIDYMWTFGKLFFVFPVYIYIYKNTLKFYCVCVCSAVSDSLQPCRL